MSAPEGWLPVEVTLWVDPVADASGFHEVRTATKRSADYFTPAGFGEEFGVPMPRPPEPTPAEFIRSLIYAGRSGVHVVIDPETEDRLNAVLDALGAS